MQLSKAHRIIAPLGFLALTALGLFAGCGGSSGAAICEMACECEGCSTVALDSCMVRADDSERLSADLGCADLYAAFSSCVAERGICVGADFSTSGCNVEAERYNNCLHSAGCHWKNDNGGWIDC